MIKEKNIINNSLFYLFFMIISIISIFCCLLLVNNNDKSLIFILPFSFFASLFLFNKNFRKTDNNIAIVIIESLFFIRMVLLPLLYSFNIDNQLFEGSVYVGSYFSKACLLMVYELFAIQATIYFHYALKEDKDLKFDNIKSKIDFSKYLMVILCVFILISILFFRNYLKPFKNIFSINDYGFTIATSDTTYDVGTFGRIIRTLFTMSFQLFRILFPAYLIRKCYINKSNYTGIVLILFCFLQFMFLTSTFAEAIISCVCLILYYMKLFPQKKKKTTKLLVLSSIGIILLYFIVRYFVNIGIGLYDKTNPLRYASQIINAYFTGVDNVAAIFNVSFHHRLEAFRADFIGAIPFNSTLFGARGNKLHFFYNSYNKSYGQIPPTIGVGFYFLGTLLAPLFSILFTKLSLYFFDKSNQIKTSFRYVVTIFCSVLFALGLVMYSPAITLSWFFGWGIPMLLITSVTPEE